LSADAGLTVGQFAANVFLLIAVEGSGGNYALFVATICSSINPTLVAVAIGHVLLGQAARL
jgi:hypothetical protein